MSITNFTFYSAVNDTVQAFNYPLVKILTVAFIVSGIASLIYFYKKQQLWFIICGLFFIWFLSGIILSCVQDSSFITDWINSAVAIGTIALAILGFTAMSQYRKQKILDHSLESAKKIAGMLLFHKLNIYI